MTIPNIPVEFTHDVPLQLDFDKDGLALTATTVASVPVELDANSGDTMTVYVEPTADGGDAVWFKLCSDTTGRATFASTPVTYKDKEVFVLPELPRHTSKYYISVIARVAGTKVTINSYKRGT